MQFRAAAAEDGRRGLGAAGLAKAPVRKAVTVLRRTTGWLVQRSETANSCFRLGVAAAQEVGPRRDIERRLAGAIAQALPPPEPPVPGRIVLVGHGLAAGGSERQMLNTLRGLDGAVRAGRLESARLLLEPLPGDGSRSFYLPQLREAGVAWQELAPPSAGATPEIERLRPLLVRALGRGHAQKVVAYAEAFRALRPEVAHVWQDWPNVLAGLGAVLAGVPGVLLSARNIAPVHFLYWSALLRPAYRALVNSGRAALFNNSRAGARDYARWLGIPESQVGVIYNGVLLPRRDARTVAAAAALRRAAGIPEGAPVVGSAFRFWPEKRPSLWLRTAAKIAAARPDAHFLIAGWGPLVEPMRTRAARAGLGRRLTIAAAQQDVAAAICAGDVFLLTSRAEGIPNVVLEAQYLGVPVIAAEAGGTAEAIWPGTTGVVAPGNPAELARHVLAWLADVERRRAVSEAGPRWIAERFGLERMVAETIAAYDRLRRRTQ